MCGRFALTTDKITVEALFEVADVEPFPPRYNIAPTQPVLMVVPGPTRAPGSNMPRNMSMLVRWGLIPSWSKDVAALPLLINARSETAATKPAFRAAMRHRRSLVPASGFYEWRKHADGQRQAYWIRPRHEELIAFGGLVETYADAAGNEMDTGALLTTDANAMLKPIHARMPVVIRQKDFTRWLDCMTQEPRDVFDLVAPVEEDFFEAIPVSDAVNRVANTAADIQTPVKPVKELAAGSRKSTKSAQMGWDF